jgi:pilus assembly protein Flp/PilA
MQRFAQFLATPRRPFEERGATAVEYGLMVTMIAVVIVSAVTFFGTRAAELFTIPANYL